VAADTPADATVPRRRVAIIGAGWAGLATAVEATQRGWQVTLQDMAPQAGGRARSLGPADLPHRLDNGQHILIGAYTETLALMRQVGAHPDALLLRRPLELLDAEGVGLRLPPGPALPAFLRGVLALQHWSLGERLALVRASTGWLLRGFACDTTWTVHHLCRTLPRRVRDELIDPLCVAALNTPAASASARVFLRVLKDALFSGPGSSDLLIPRCPLAELLPEPALRWLTAHGATVHLGQRVTQVQPVDEGWQVGGARFDAVVLACSAAEAARLAAPTAPAWAAQAAGLAYQPIVTTYLRAPGARLAAPMVALAEGPHAPAQFAFDHAALGGQAGRFALVVSGAADWVAQGLPATEAAVLAQAQAVLRTRGGTEAFAGAITVERTVTEKRATFACVPGLQRPATQVSGQGQALLLAAGDYLAGPYPATLEGAVRSGRAAAQALPG
jgi:hydroxysqualene dehydroxylase